jgi:hypothetical protein
VDDSVIAFGVFHVLDDDVAGLQCGLSEAHFQEFYIADFLIDFVFPDAHQFLRHHVLVLADEGFLRAVEPDQNCHEVDLLIFDALLGLAFLHWQHLPLLGGVLILFAAHLLDVLLRGDFDHLPGEFGVVFNVVGESADDATQGVVALE